LIFLTNDGQFALRLTHPPTRFKRSTWPQWTAMWNRRC
jgi:16S rRNA U516 pseudouridylate synthase RsuA-like enzyme